MSCEQVARWLGWSSASSQEHSEQYSAVASGQEAADGDTAYRLFSSSDTGGRRQERWMEEEEEACSRLRPMQFCFPGTHDTGACQPPTGDVVDGERTLMSRLMQSRTVRNVVGKWTMTQSTCTIQDQLIHGVRFLDLRVAAACINSALCPDCHDDDDADDDVDGDRHGGGMAAGDGDGCDEPDYSRQLLSQSPEATADMQFVVTHTFVVGLLVNVVRDIRRFVRTHRKELILVSVAPYFKLNCPAIRAFIMKHLKGRVCPAELALNRTVREITDAGYNVILMWSGGNQYHVPPASNDRFWLLAKDYMYGPWRSIGNVQEKQDYLHSQLEIFEQDPELAGRKLFQLGYTLTPGVSDFLWGVTLERRAEEINRSLGQFLGRLSCQRRRLINVITVDYITASDVVEVARNLLNERLPHVILAGPACEGTGQNEEGKEGDNSQVMLPP